MIASRFVAKVYKSSTYGTRIQLYNKNRDIKGGKLLPLISLKYAVDN